jgi:hypothetical protein
VKIEKLIEKNKENYEKIAISEGAIFNGLSWLKMFLTIGFKYMEFMIKVII